MISDSFFYVDFKLVEMSPTHYFELIFFKKKTKKLHSPTFLKMLTGAYPKLGQFTNQSFFIRNKIIPDLNNFMISFS